MVQAVQRAEVSASAVRDTIAAIASQSAYERALTDSLWNRIVRWIVERVNDFLSTLEGTPTGRWVTIGLLVTAIVLVTLRIVIGINAERAVRRAPRTGPVTGAGAALLSDAQRLAASGDYTGAAHALFAALLVACAARGEVRLHASKTTGDYARELRRRNSTALPPFQAFRGRYDRVIYGDQRVSADDYAALETEAHRMLGSS